MALAFLITGENLQLLSERKVLKQSEYAALLEAAQVVDSARAEAQRIVQRAHEQAEQGRREGYEAGLQQAKSEYADRLLAAAADGQRQLQSLREAMARLVARAVTQFIAEVDPAELLDAALQRVDALVRNESFLDVRVAPEQEQALRQAIERLRADARWTMNVTVQVDPALPDGACVLQTPSGTLEIGVEAQLQAFYRALAQGPGAGGLPDWAMTR